MKAMILAENLPGNMQGEHGLSIYIENNGGRYLLDMGQSALFAHNAQLLGIDLTRIDLAFLSHGHYDHGGGLETFLSLNSTARVCCRPEAFEPHYGGTDVHYNGLDQTVVRRFPARFQWIEKTTEVAERVWVIPHTKLPRKDACLFCDHGQGIRPDDFCHEQILVMDSAHGLVIFTSCSHTGIDQALEEVQSALPGKAVYAAVGGFHLENPSERRLLYSEKELADIAQRMLSMGVQHVITGHCTGAAFETLHKRMGNRCVRMHTGMEIRFD